MSGMREKFRRTTDSLYWRQFVVTAGMVLLTMALLGVSFYALSYNYTVSEKRQEMRDRADLVAQLSVDYLTAGDDAERDQEEALRTLAGVASRMTEVIFLICTADGQVLLTTDSDLAGQSVTVPAEITEKIVSGGGLYEGRSTVGVYEKKQFVVGVPMRDETGALLGMVLAVMNSANFMEMWRSFIALFFMTSAIILVISFVASFVTSMRQIQPITEMVKATRAYADGNFDVRMQETEDAGGEIGELAAAFNAMADSLQETERQRRDFIANVSHELKTPLQGIIGSAELLENGMVQPEDVPRFVGHIRAEAQRLVALVNDIIGLSRLDEGDEMPSEPVELLALCRETAAALESAAAQRQVSLSVTGQEVTVPGVRRLLSEVLTNLCDNAVKYNVPGGSVAVTVTANEDNAAVTVSDTGIGIPADQQSRVFERFYRVDKSHSKASGGTGLGLSIVKHAVAYHHGTVSLTSREGEGTTVTVTLPLK